MASTVLVANRIPAEAQAIALALGQAFAAKPVETPDALNSSLEGAAALVLDVNFSDAQGLDVLMDVRTRSEVPVLIVTPLDDPSCAVEALRCGAMSHLVKAGDYLRVVSLAIEEIIRRSTQVDVLQREIVGLQKRIAELTGRNASQTPSTKMEPSSSRPRAKRSLAEEIEYRLRAGELVLPPYPGIALKLRQLMDSDAGMSEVGRVLSQDAAISGKLLQLANAAQFAQARKVHTIEDAISRLGLDGACNTAELVANKSLYASGNATYRACLEELWVHGVACAHASEILGRRTEQAGVRKLFLLGLLHDVGKLALLQIIAQVDPEGTHVATPADMASFRKFLRQHHVQFGLTMMQRWKLDADFHEIARYHDNLQGAGTLSRPLLIVHLANLLARARGYGESLDNPDALEAAPSKAFFSLTAEDIQAAGEALDKAVQGSRDLLAG